MTMNNTKNERAVATQKYERARANLLLVIILTALNLVMLPLGTEIFMLFSATVPYIALVVGIFSGMTELLVICSTVAVVGVLLYLLCYIFSKKRVGWLVCALVLFVLDTIFLIGVYVSIEDLSGFVDLIVHIWVLFYLISGVRAGFKLKKLPEEVIEVEATDVTDSLAEGENSAFLRTADESVKSRVLLEATYSYYRICYRRVKSVNELVINGRVYDEYVAVLEKKHTLTAMLDGHKIEAGFDGTNSTIKVDGEQIASKLRWY